MLIGRPEVIGHRLKELSLTMRPDRDFDLIVPCENTDFETHWRTFYERVQRRGYAPDEAREYIRNDPTVLAATMVRCGDADAMICGVVGRFARHLKHVEEVIGTAPDVRRLTAMNAIVLPAGPLFIADTYVQSDPSAEDLAEITFLCAAQVRRFGLRPKIALLSHSNFGSHESPAARKMQEAMQLLRTRAPSLEVEGEMHANLALNAAVRESRFPDSKLSGRANLLIMPNQDAANIAFNLLRTINEGGAFGPMLLGADRAAHIVTPSTSVRGLLNMTALAAVQAE
jgi:malate dehydrogenase (oxaloacetate-decarboxylating)(NADP+)